MTLSLCNQQERGNSLRCADQLIISKMVLDQVKQQWRNLFMTWFHYQKAFDSVPHSWI